MGLVGYGSGKRKHRAFVLDVCCKTGQILSLKLFKVGCNSQRIVSIRPSSIGQLSPAIECAMEGILSLPLESLEAELLLQVDLSLVEVRLPQHPAKSGQQSVGINVAALETDQDSVFVCVAAKAGAAAFHEVGQLKMIHRPASPAEHRTQKLVPASLPAGVGTAASPDPELGGQHPCCGHRIKNQITVGIQSLSSDRAIRVKLFSG